MRLQTLALWPMVLWALVAQPIHASTFVALDQDDLILKSSMVVEGEVLDIQSFWNAESTMIYTDVQFLVTDVILGEASSLVTVRVSGGKVGGVSLEAQGFPIFEKAARMVLFLEPLKESNAVMRVVGYQQGEYKIVPGPAGESMVIPMVSWSAASYVGQKGRTVDLRPKPLAELKDSLRSRAAALDAQKTQSEGGEK